MKILHTVEYYSPSLGGAQEVVRQVSEQLAARGHTVVVATTMLSERSSRNINGIRIEEFDISGNDAIGFRGETDAYQGFLLESRFDVMMNYAAQQWASDLAFPLLDQIPYRKVLAPCGFSGLHHPLYTGYYQKMPAVLSAYDHLMFTGSKYRDIDFASAHGVGHWTIIPNGASEAEFGQADLSFRRRYRISEENPLLLTVGTHTGTKGHRLTMESFRRARIGKATLLIVGNSLESNGCLRSCRRRAKWTTAASWGQKRVLLLDLPRPDVVAAFHAADLFVLGSNIECSPLVLFESMASRTAFVTLACGNAAEIVEWSNGGVVAPTFQLPNGLVDGDPDQMARLIEVLIDDKARRAMLAEAGWRAWQNRFTWEKIALNYERLYMSLT